MKFLVICYEIVTIEFWNYIYGSCDDPIENDMITLWCIYVAYLI
jgi:hypothetical protein